MNDPSKLPTSLAQAMAYQPLNYLIPKSNLSKLLLPKPNAMTISDGGPVFNDPRLNDAQAKMIDAINSEDPYFEPALHQAKEVINFNLMNDEEESSLVFKSLPISSGDETLNGFQGLSKFAYELIKETPLVDIEKIASTPQNKVSATVKREMVPIVHEREIKKSKIETTTVSQYDLATNYKNILHNTLETIGMSDEVAEYQNFELWKVTDNDDYPYILTHQSLSTIEACLKNIYPVEKLRSEIDITELRRTQTLCNNIINFVSTLDLEPSNISFEYCLMAARACCINLHILLFGRPEKELFMEECVKVPFDFISTLITTVLVPLSRDKSLVTDPTNSNMWLNIISVVTTFMFMVPAFISNHIVDDTFITKLEYLTIEITMSESFFGFTALQNAFDVLRLASISILNTMYLHMKDQRSFILDELLSNMSNIPARSPRRVKTKRGSNLTYFSFALLSMVQSLNISEFESFSDLTPEIEKLFDDKFIEVQRECNYVFQSITTAIISKVSANITSNRYILETIISDLLSVLTHPEWPAAETLLSAITQNLLMVFTPDQNASAMTEAFALQSLGLVAKKLLRLKLLHGEQPKLSNGSLHLSEIMNDYTKVVTYLYTLTSSSSFTENAFQFMWMKQMNLLKKSDVSPEINAQRQKLIIDQFGNGYAEYLRQRDALGHDQLILKAYEQTLFTGSLLDLYEPFLLLLVSLLEKDKAKLRSGAIKVLSNLITEDSNLLSSPVVRDTISKRLQDSSTLVKDAVIDLLSETTCLEEFYVQINSNYDDASTSVRRRVLKMNQRMYKSSQDTKVRAYIAERILRRTEDEDTSIIQYARDNLMEMWVFSIANASDKVLEQRVTQDVIKIMCYVVTANDKACEMFDDFLNFYILNSAEHLPHVYENIIRSIQTLLNHLIDLSIQENPNEQLVPKDRLLALLSIFSTSDFSFVTREQLITLQPYLTLDGNSSISFYALKIYRHILPKLEDFKPKFLIELETSLLSRLSKMNIRELEQTMPLLWTICQQRGDESRLINACTSCLDHLKPYISRAVNRQLADADGRVSRLLYLTGNFGRFCSFKDPASKFPFLKPNEALYEHIIKSLIVFTRENVHPTVKRIAIRNLITVSSAHPKVFNSKVILNVIDDAFAGKEMDIKLVMIENLYDFLSQEERNDKKTAGVNGTSSKTNKLNKKVFYGNESVAVNDGICSALVLRYVDTILKLCIVDSGKNSYIAIKFIKLVVQMGYTNPTVCLPTIIALLASTTSQVKKIAIEMFEVMMTKYENMIPANIGNGIKLAYEYAQNLSTERFYSYDRFLNTLQSLIMDSKKLQKKLVSTIEKLIISCCDIENSEYHYNLMLFLTFNVAHMKFETYGEVYHLIKEVDKHANNFYEEIMSIIDEDPKETPALKTLCTIALMVLELRRVLFEKYSLHEEKLHSNSESKSTIKSLHPEASVKLRNIKVRKIVATFRDMTDNN